MSRDHILALGAGAASAFFWLALGGTMPGALILVLLPLFVMGLGWGLAPALIAGAAGAVVVFAASAPLSAGMFGLAAALPVVALVHLALQSRPRPDGSVEWYPPGYLLSWLAAISLAYLVLVALYYAGHDRGLEGAAVVLLKSRLAVIMPDLPPDRLDAFTALMARFLPAAMLGMWQLMVIAAGVLAHGVLSRFGRNIRPGAPFASLELPRWTAIVLAVCALASFVGGQVGFVGRTGVVLMAIPFFFLGLSVIHAVSRRWRGREFVLLLVYLLILFLGWPAALVAGLGFVEQWLGLRGRHAGPGAGQEEE